MENTPQNFAAHAEQLLADGDVTAITAAMDDFSWKAMQLMEAGEEAALQTLNDAADRLQAWLDKHGIH